MAAPRILLLAFIAVIVDDANGFWLPEAVLNGTRAPAKFSDLLPPVAADELPLDVGYTDTDSPLDMDEGAIERLFETYERQYLHDDIAAAQSMPLGSETFDSDGAVSALLPTPHSIKSRQTEDGSSGIVSTVRSVTEVLTTVTTSITTGESYSESTIDEKRSREQHETVALGLGHEWSATLSKTDDGPVGEQPVGIAIETSSVKTVNSEAVLAEINNNVEASSINDHAAQGHLHSAESLESNEDTSAESSALDNIATIVNNEYVLKELSKDIPKDDYVPLDVAVSDAVHAADAFVVYEQPPQDQGPVAAVADVSMQYDIGRIESVARSARHVFPTSDSAIKSDRAGDLFQEDNITAPAPIQAAADENVEIIAQIPVDESFSDIPAAESTASHVELLHLDFLLPSETKIDSNKPTLGVDEVKVSSENKNEALDSVTTVSSPEGSGDDDDDNTNAANPTAQIVAEDNDSAESTEKRNQHITETHQIVKKNQLHSRADSVESAKERDSGSETINKNRQMLYEKNTQDSDENNDDSNKGTDDDEDEDDGNDAKPSVSTFASQASDVLQSVVDAVELSTDLNRALQSFHDAEAENAAIRQTRSGSAGPTTAVPVVPSNVDGLLVAAEAKASTLDTASAARSRHDNLIKAVLGYIGLLMVLSIAIGVMMFMIFSRRRDARRRLVTATV